MRIEVFHNAIFDCFIPLVFFDFSQKREKSISVRRECLYFVHFLLFYLKNFLIQDVDLAGLAEPA